MELGVLLILFIIGTFIGSFLTNCIERLPFGEDDFYAEPWEPENWYFKIPLFSLFLAMPLYTRFKSVLPSSRCPCCSKRLRYREKFPILSYIYLGGRCSSCSYKIPLRHLLVELLTGILFVIFALRFDFGLRLLVSLFMVSLFVVATVVDIRYQIIPDEVNLLGLSVGLLLALFKSLVSFVFKLFENDPAIHKPSAIFAFLKESFILEEFSLGFAIYGAVVGSGTLMLLYYAGTALAGTDAMGGGDVKLAGFIGSFLGAKGVLVALLCSTVLGAVFGVFILILGYGSKEGGFTKFAFGPYICFGTLLTMYLGVDEMIRAYSILNQSLVSLFLVQHPQFVP